MNTRTFVIIIVVLFILILAVLNIGDVRFLRASIASNEDNVVCAHALYVGLARAGVELDSQCLGICGNYSIDLVHVPRRSVDDVPENQCREYRENITVGFIELDRDGNVVRIVG